MPRPRRQPAPRTIGIGDAEPHEHPAFERLHALGIRPPLMVEAEQMEDAMDDEMREMVGQRLALGLRLFGDRAEAQYDIAERHRHAGRAPDPGRPPPENPRAWGDAASP